MTLSYVLSINSPFGPLERHVEINLFWRFNVHALYFEAQALLRLASQATNQGCLVLLACFTIASTTASFLGVHHSECRKYMVKTRVPPLTFTHAWALHSQRWTYLVLLDNCTPHYCRLLRKFLSTCACERALSSVILAASAANLHPYFTSVLNCSFISSFLIPCSITKKTSNVPLYLLVYFFTVHHAEPLSKVHLTAFDVFLHFTHVLHVLPFFETFLCLLQTMGLLQLSLSVRSVISRRTRHPEISHSHEDNK